MEDLRQKSHIPDENVLDLRAIERKRQAARSERQGKQRRGLTRIFRRWRSGRRSRLSPPPQTPSFTQATPLISAPIVTPEPKPSPKPASTSTPTANSQKSSTLYSWQSVPSAVRQLAVFVLVALLVLIPIHAVVFYERADAVRTDVLGSSLEAFSQLDAGLTDPTVNAQESFQEAIIAFQSARETFAQFHTVLVGLSDVLPGQGSQLASGQRLLVAGQALAEAAETLSGGLSATPQEDGLRFSSIRQSLVSVLTSLRTAINALNGVDSNDVPTDYRTLFASMQGSFPELLSQLERAERFVAALGTVFGEEGPRRYLVLFQNNRELRPTGGFIGSFALVEFEDGKLTELHVPGGGPYEINPYLEELVVAPRPLHIVNPHWYLQDANWFPDFPTSAKKILWFYEKSGGPTVDGVLTLTPTVLERLLEVAGPVDMIRSYGTIITAENVVNEAQRIAEIDYDKEENAPKQFIADLLPKVIDQFSTLSSEAYTAVLAAFADSLAEKHILLYSTNDELEARIRELGWGGEVLSTDGDYLAVIDTNIGGGKTDWAIDRDVRHEAAIQPDGSVVDTVTITRTHRGNPDDVFAGVHNVSYLRVYVPQGSTLLDATGFDPVDPKRFILPDPDYREDADLLRVEGDALIDARTGTRIGKEFGKTVFANWTGVAPGESVTVSISYRLPFTVKPSGLFTALDGYSLLLQKQPGTFAWYLESTVTFPQQWGVTWMHPHGSYTEGRIRWERDLATDRSFGAIFTK